MVIEFAEFRPEYLLVPPISIVKTGPVMCDWTVCMNDEPSFGLQAVVSITQGGGQLALVYYLRHHHNILNVSFENRWFLVAVT